MKVYDSEGNFISFLVKKFLWSAVSSFGFPLQRRCRCTGVCPVKVVCGSMWWWVRRSSENKACFVWGRWRGGILLLSSGTGGGSERPEQFLEVHGDRTRGNGTKLQQGKFCLDTRKMKGKNQLTSYEHLCGWRYSLGNVLSSCLLSWPCAELAIGPGISTGSFESLLCCDFYSTEPVPGGLR